MSRLRLVLALTFIGSFATVLVERGIYFYSVNALTYSRSDNLWLAMLIGVCYVTGALMSHPLAHRTGERRLLIGLFASQIFVDLLFIVFSKQREVFLWTNIVRAWLTGATWPVIESYVAAGRSADETLEAVGRFNIAWALSVPLAFWLTGPLIASGLREVFFAVTAGFNLASLFLVLRLSARPPHVAHDHPERPPADHLRRLGRLMISSRWFMLLSYVLFFLLVPLMPQIFARFVRDVPMQTFLGGTMDLWRLLAFILLWRLAGWHGRGSLLVWVAIGLPLGFYMVLLGNHIAIVMVGELVFGFAAGLAYFSALYYAVLVVKNASVDAGGAHEGLVGLGYCVGPGLGLVGLSIAEQLVANKLSPEAANVRGMIEGTGPAVLVCIALGLGALMWGRKKDPEVSRSTAQPRA